MISIVIPALNEETNLPQTLQSVLCQSEPFEVILVDGNSQDRTRELAAAEPKVRVVKSAPGRSRQMNLGAREARGEWLLFLHADTRLPPHALDLIRSLSPQDRLAGGFHQAFDDAHPALRLLSALHNWRASVSRLFYGDQAFFIRRSLFIQMEGFREDGVMEDVEFGARLLKQTTPILLPQTVITSSRKFRAMGVWRGFFQVLWLFMSYNWLPRMITGRESFFRNYR